MIIYIYIHIIVVIVYNDNEYIHIHIKRHITQHVHLSSLIYSLCQETCLYIALLVSDFRPSLRFFFCRSAPLSRLVPRVQQYFGSRALGMKLTVTIPTSAKVSVSRATYLPKKLRKAPQKVPGSTKSYPSFQQCSFCFNLLLCVWSS